MMERYLVTSEQWAVWLALLEEQRTRAAELDARASLLCERDTSVSGVIRAMLEAARIERELDAPVVRRRARRGWWVALPLALALAAGVLVVQRFEPTTHLRWRGAETSAPAASVLLEQDGVALARVGIGAGLRPALTIDGRPLVIRSGARTVAWTVRGGRVADLDGRAGGVTPLTEDRAWEPQLPTTLVVAVLPAEADPGTLARAIGDGRSAVEAMGDVRMVAFDLVAR